MTIPNKSSSEIQLLYLSLMGGLIKSKDLTLENKVSFILIGQKIFGRPFNQNPK